MPNSPKILAVRVGRAGDLIMITPALRALLTAMPTAELHLLTSAEGARVMRGFDPRLTRTWIYSRRFPRSWLLQPDLLRRFRAEAYDRVYVFEAKPVYRRWLAGAGREFFGLDAGAPQIHYSERCLQTVDASLAAPAERGWVALPVSAQGRERADQLLRQHGLDPGTDLVGLHPTFSGSRLPFFRDRAGMRHRHWPSENFAALARLLADHARERGRPLSVVIDALPQEKKIVEPIAAMAGGAITLLSAPPDFERYKALLAAMRVLVVSNTGPMHIAAAVGTPVVALFSGWSRQDCGPYTDPGRVQILAAEDMPDPGLGLAAITPQAAAAAVLRVLEAPRC